MNDQTIPPTTIYIKVHSKTGKLYIGKTRKKDIDKYQGSGLEWKTHCEEHGWEHVRTVWTHTFTDPLEMMFFASFFSISRGIRISPLWANKHNEHGYDRPPHPPEVIEGMVAKNTGQKRKEYTYKEGIVLGSWNVGRKWTEEERLMRAANRKKRT